MTPGLQVRGHGAHSQKLAEIATGSSYLFCFLSPIPCGLSAPFPIPMLTAFEITDVNRCQHAYRTVYNLLVLC